MDAYEQAKARAAQAMDDLRLSERAYRFGMHFEGTELRARSAAYFRDALSQLILAAAQLQRVGAVPRILLRRGVAVAPRILLNVSIDNRELEFISVVDLDGEARALCCETGSEGRIPLIRHWDLGHFEAAGVILAHRLAVTEFLAEVRPVLVHPLMCSVPSTMRSPETYERVQA